MPIISQDTDDRYWKVIDIDPLPNGTFNVEAKQVQDKDGNRLVAVSPAPHKVINRPTNVLPVGTIVKITDVTTVERTFTPNPTT